MLANLVIGEETALSGESASLSNSRRWRIETSVTWIDECERLSVKRQTHDDLGRITTKSDVVVEGVIGVEIGDVGLGMIIKWSDVTRFLVPMAVVIVRHYADPIQVAGNGWNIIRGIDDRFGR